LTEEARLGELAVALCKVLFEKAKEAGIPMKSFRPPSVVAHTSKISFLNVTEDEMKEILKDLTKAIRERAISKVGEFSLFLSPPLQHSRVAGTIVHTALCLGREAELQYLPGSGELRFPDLLLECKPVDIIVSVSQWTQSYIGFASLPWYMYTKNIESPCRRFSALIMLYNAFVRRRG